jgi:hypothetical protein
MYEGIETYLWHSHGRHGRQRAAGGKLAIGAGHRGPNDTGPCPGWSGFRMLVGTVSGDSRADVVWSMTATINRTYVALSRL